MSVNSVKILFIQEFSNMGLTAYEMRNTFIQFCNDLFEAGEINAKVYNKCLKKI